jgi:DNA-binding response OmpR family regulator
MNDYITKPIVRAELLAILDRYAHRATEEKTPTNG